VVAWLAVLVAAWVAVPPVLTGKKDAYGYPQPANPAEQRKLSTWRAWAQLRWRLVLPSSDWLPGWPPLAAWAAAVVVGAICFLWPVRAFPHYHVKMAAEHWADALAGAWLVASVTAARRAATQGAAGGPARPATRFDAKLVAALRNNPVASTVTGGIGASMGALAGIAARYGLARYHHWAAQWAVHHPHHVPPPQWAVVAPHMAWLAPLSAVGGALAGIGAAWHQEATGHWRKVSASSDEWAPRWASLKIDPAPALVDHRELGPAMIWTFDAPPGLGAQAMWGQYKKISPTLGAGLAVAVLEHPDGAPGTRHPIRFNVIAWSELPDFTDPGLSPELATWAAHSCFAWATEAAGYGRPVPVAVEWVSAEGARSAWASRWAWPGGPGLVDVKAIAEGIDKAFGCEVLIDHKADTVFFGALGAGEGNEGLPPDLAKHLSDLRVQQVWDKRWSQIAGIKDHPPICRPETAMTAELEDGTEVHRQAFVTRQGIDPAEVRGLEPKIATTLQAAPYVAVCGWPVLDGRPGERHPQAMTIYWADETVPTSPEHMGRSEAAAWVLAGMANKAFDDGHLARPELAGAVELSAPGQRSHLWALRLRLYGGVVVSNVRSQVSKLQQALQVSWLRVAATDEPDLVIVYAGAVPSGLALEGGERAQLALVALDWEQAWLDSKVVGAAGEPPKLAGLGHMPHNADVSVLDFTLPSGVDRSIVRAARGKLRAATGNAYVEDADSPKGADAVRLLVSRDIPLPKLAPVDWGAMDGSGALAVPVGTGTDGEPVFFDLQDSAHLLVVGATGSGKAQPLTSRVPVPVSEKFPTGWATIGELEIGDELFAADGSVTSVVGMSLIENKPVYEVVFDDGQSVECSLDHLWKVSSAASRAARTPSRSARRAARYESFMRQAADLRRAAQEIGPGVVATLSQVAALIGASPFTLYGLAPPGLAVKTEVPVRRKANSYSMDDVISWLRRHQRGGMTVGGRYWTADDLVALGLSGAWLTFRELTRALLGRDGTRHERNLTRRMLRHAKPARNLVTTTCTTTVYPVDEIIIFLAERLEQMASVPNSRRKVIPLEQVVSTSEMRGRLKGNSERFNWAVRLPSPPVGQACDLSLDPYVLGAWLGDGHSRRGTITVGVCDLEEMERLLKEQWPYIRRCASGSHYDLILHAPDPGRCLRGHDPQPRYRDGSCRVCMHHQLGEPWNVSLGVVLKSIGVLHNKHIPAQYLRAALPQRLALLQGLMDTDGTIGRNGSCELTLCNERLAHDALELIRSLGIKASISSCPATITEADPNRPGTSRRREVGTRWRVCFTTSLQVFRLPRKACRTKVEVRKTGERLYVVDVRETHRVVPMRCLVVEHPEHMYLTEEFVPTHNSVLLSVLVYGWLAKGAKVVVVDPVKGGADFAFAQGWARFATDLDGAVAAVRAAYAEASLRKQANAAAKVSSWLDMDEPPAPLVVLIDEFTSVLIPSPVPKKTGDPELDSELEALEEENRSRTEIGVLVSKLAREARSAGVVVLLAAQKLAADTLEKIPGKDLKTNLGRALIGQASDGERLSALRAPRDAPVLSGDIPPGRGLYEPIRRTAVLAQFWYATQAELGDQLRRRLPPPTEAPVLEPPQDDDEMVDVGELELSLEDLLGGEKDDETEEIEGAGPLENENTANEVNDSMTAGVENGEDDQGIAENVPEEALFAGNGASHGPSWPEKSHAGPDELFPEPEPVVGPYDDPFN
jgi:hypothetical protein